MKLLITSRDCVEVVNLDKVVYLKADGNYTDFYFSDGKVRSHLSTLSVFEEAITARYAVAGIPSPFFRMGRSYFVNASFIASVNLARNILLFDTEAVKPVIVARGQLKLLRAFVDAYYHNSLEATSYEQEQGQ